MTWLSRNAPSVEAVAASVTALAALAAIVGVKYQLDAADTAARAQSARDAYRSHLALSVANPDLALPTNACTLIKGPKSGAYTAFVDHLLYSAEQMLEVGEGWEATFSEALDPHVTYICSDYTSTGSTNRVETLVRQFRAANCEMASKCS